MSNDSHFMPIPISSLMLRATWIVFHSDLVTEVTISVLCSVNNSRLETHFSMEGGYGVLR